MKNIFSKNTNYFISRDKWFDGLSQKDVIALFEKALTTIPQYNTIEIVGVRILKTDSIVIQNVILEIRIRGQSFEIRIREKTFEMQIQNHHPRKKSEIRIRDPL